MKKLIIGIIIGITLSLSTLTFASSAIKLIMVPEYIKGYKTTDLLEYIANQKSLIDTKEKEQIKNNQQIKLNTNNKNSFLSA
jgi:hypothetical protein